jgi:sugar lactone lactonase YvrE
MKLDLTIRRTTELGVALSFVAVLTIAGCGGSGSSDTGRSLLQMGGSKQGSGLNLMAAVSTLAGSSAAASGAIDATGVSATFNYPQGIASDGKNLYVADSFNNTIRKIVIATGEVTTLAGSSAAVADSLDGTGTAALFWEPTGITTDGIYLYVTDNINHTIRKVKIDTGEVTTLAGLAGVSGVADTASGVHATFNYPTGITTDGTNLYVADSSSNTIRKIVIASGEVTTFAGSSAAEAGMSDSVVVVPNPDKPNELFIDNTTARFSQPTGITTDGSNLYVADSFNNAIRKITIASGVVSTLAGSNVGQHGMADSVVISSPADPSILIYDGTTARFWQPVGITTDGSNLYVTDTVNNSIRKILIATGRVITLAAASSAGAPGTMDSSDGWLAKFNHPRGITTDGTSLYVVDSLNNTIRKIQ